MSLHLPTLNRAVRRHHEAIEFAAVYVALAVFPLVDVVAPRIAFHVGSLTPDGLPGGVLLGRSWVWLVVSMVVVGVGYATIRGLRVPTGLPDRDDAGAVAVCTLSPLLVVAGYVLGTHAIDTSVAAVESTAAFPSPGIGFLWWNVVVPGILIGVGYGVLFYGAILGGLAGTLTARESLFAITTLAGLYHWLVDPIFRLARSNALLEVALVLVVGTGLAVVGLVRMDGAASVRDALTPTRVVALALAAVLAFGVAVDVISGATTVGDLLAVTGWVVVFAIAAWGRHRTRTVWVPTATIAVFQVAVLGVPYLEASLGLVATGP